jgi:hypothetical protein
MSAADFADLITGAKPNGRGYTGCCPAHDDTRPSLAWADGETGLVVTCHRGCTHAQICAALGIPVSALFRDRTGPVRHASTATGRGARGSIVATYDYLDLDGRLLYQVVRYDHPKGFHQRRPTSGGQDWIYNLGETARVLYRLPEIQGQPEVVIVEGEKDVDRLRSLGVSATTNAMGAGKWQDSYTEQLLSAGIARFVIIGDNDHAGQAHARVIAASLTKYLPDGDIRLITLPGLSGLRDKHGEDVSDWLDAGHTIEELADLVAAWTPTAVATPLLLGVGLGEFLTCEFPDAAPLIDGLPDLGRLRLDRGRGEAGQDVLCARGRPRPGPWRYRRGPLRGPSASARRVHRGGRSAAPRASPADGPAAWPRDRSN